MDEVKKKKGFLMACKEYFGYSEGQTLKGFADEMSRVDFTFRTEIYKYFKSIGIVCEVPILK